METNELPLFAQILIWVAVGLIGGLCLEAYHRLTKSKTGKNIKGIVKPEKKISTLYVIIGLIILIALVYLVTQNANNNL